MRVLQIIARMNVGGTARYLDVLTSGLTHAGITTELATGFVQGGEAEDSCLSTLPHVRIPHLGRRIDPVNDLRARAELKNAISSFQPDIIHTHTFKAGLIGRTLAPGVPHVHTFHGHLLDDPEMRGVRRRLIVSAERRLARRADHLITVGKRVAEELIAAQIGNLSQFSSIPPGVSPLMVMDREAARASLGLDSGQVTVAWLARMTPVKNPLRVLDLAHRFPNVMFLMAGGGELLDIVQRQAPANVTVLGWADPAVVYSAADVALSTSHNEGMPVSLIEAQLAGLPVIAGDVGSVAEVIEDGVTGYVVTPGHLPTALESLLRDPETRARMGAAARERAQRRFSPNAMVDAHIRLYEGLLAA